jgi:Predicted hydrolase of the metallo-beta-lactamase superfamily
MNLIIHRGTHEIGGSCVEVKTATSRILLDFGMPLGNGRGGEFDEQALEGKSIAELIKKKILYPIDGLYKDSAPQVDAILISHSHKDHYGFLKFAHPDIPGYMSAGAEKLINVLNIFVKKEGRLLLPKAAQLVRDRKSFDIRDLCITPYLVDHSAFDAMSFHVVEKTSGKSIFYTGDFRAAGWKEKLFDRFVVNPPKGVNCLLMEGTMIEREAGKYPTERDILDRMIKILSETDKKITFAYCSGQNIDRIVTFYRAARGTKSILVIDPYTACVLNAIKSSHNHIPQMDWDSVRVFIANYYGKGDVYVSKISDSVFKNLLPSLANTKIKPPDFPGLKEKTLVLMRGSMIPALEKIPGIRGLKIVYSQWKGYLDKDSSDSRKFKAFISKYELDLEHVHTSGHATVDKLKRFAAALNPKILIPIHTFEAKKISKLIQQC